MKYGINIIPTHPASPTVAEQIAIFAKAGFDAFFLGSGITESYEKIPKWAALAEGYGIRLTAVHIPLKFKGCDMDDLWRGYLAGERYRNETKKLLDLCARGKVGKVILHVAHKIPAPAPSEEGLRSFRELEDYAKARSVQICYENCKHSEHLAAVMEGADPFHGFCYDSGHHHCYTPKEDLLGLYGARLAYTHLHDNLGHWEDLHLLPGDGNLDWSKVKEYLKNYAGTVNLELSCTYRAPYRAMKFEEFAALAYARAKELKEKL